jgi:hypothetical protein
MADVQSQLLLKRKPTNNGKVQIRDKQTGKIYKSKNNVYQTMLEAGELKELVEKAYSALYQRKTPLAFMFSSVPILTGSRKCMSRKKPNDR